MRADTIRPGDLPDPLDVQISPLAPDDVPRLRDALAEANPPVDDLTLPGRRFFRFGANADTVGFGGLEGEGRDVLLRSVVVFRPWRGRGAGQVIVRRLEAEANRAGAGRLHVLTTTAGRFFQRLGYAPLARISAPPAIAATRQFTSLCPANADYLVKPLLALAG